MKLGLCLLVLLGLLAAARAFAGVPNDRLQALAANPAALSALVSNFTRQRSTQLAVASSGSNAKRDSSSDDKIRPGRPAPGTSWPFWYRGSYSVGNSTFNFGTVGPRDVSRIDLATVPCISAVDPVNKLWLTVDPIAGQLTTATASYIWFPAPGLNQIVCFVNSTAGYDNQAAAHAAVGNLGISISADVAIRLGRSQVYRTVTVDAWHAFGLTQNFGKTHLGAMPFWAVIDTNNDTLSFGFDQGLVVGQNPPGSGNCPVEQNSFVGGRYVFTNPGNVVLPLSAAPANTFVADPSCYTDGDVTKGFSPFLPPYDSFVCGRC